MGETIESHRVEAVWESTRLQLGGSEYSLATQGEQSLVLLVKENTGDREPAYIVKVPRLDTPVFRQLATYEANIVQYMHLSDVKPPVHVPTLLGGSEDQEKLPWYAFSYVPGQILSHREIYDQFSERELQQLGRTVGRFILWFSGAVSLDDFEAIKPPGLIPVDRIGRFLKAAPVAMKLGSEGYPAIGKVGDWSIDAYELYTKLGALLPPDRMGHEDIRPANMAFRRHNGQWLLNGLFDFGIAQPSTREREARHMCVLGRPVARETLQVCYSGCIEPMVVHDKFISAEDVTWLWANMQELANFISRHEHREPDETLPLRFERLHPRLLEWFKWEEAEN